MNRLLMVMVMLALGAVLAACGTAADPEVPPPTSTELPSSATDVPSEAPLNATEILAHTQEMMDQQSFRGSFAFAPSRPMPTFTYAPGLTLLQDMGGDWPPFLLLSRGTALSSESGTRWLTSPDNSSSGLFFGVISDPRVALRFPDAPEIVGEEAIDGHTYLVVSTGLDVEALVDTTPPQEPHVRAILSFSYPEGADAQKLEGLGYDVFGYPLEDSAEWEAFKGPYHLSFSERADRPGRKILGLPRVLAGVEVRCTGPRRSGATSADVDRGCRMPTGASLHLARPLRLRNGGPRLQALVVFGKTPWCQQFPGRRANGDCWASCDRSYLKGTIACPRRPLCMAGHRLAAGERHTSGSDHHHGGPRGKSLQ